jgi:RNA polymerase sigma-70 factor (ECF subfamily)
MANRSLLVDWRKRWNGSLFQFLSRRVRTVVDIEDLAQETYLRLLRARDLKDVRNPQAYLLRIASHVISEWREETASTEGLPIDDGFLADHCLPELELDAAASQERLNRVLDEMSPLMRAIVLLRLRDERSCKDIAAELNLTPRQVKRHLAKGYDRLRRVVEP